MLTRAVIYEGSIDPGTEDARYIAETEALPEGLRFERQRSNSWSIIRSSCQSTG